MGKTLRKTLKPFQIIGARFLATHPHGMLADEPGLGKTIQAIAAVTALWPSGSPRIRVVCPASVRTGWAQELQECLGAAPEGWEIISYNGAVSRAPFLPSDPHSDAPWDAIILDEAHFCKTPDSQRTLAVFENGRGLARHAKRVWCLTGTPVLNRPRELYPVLKTLAPGFEKTSWAAFTQRYCGAFFDGRGINTKGASHLEELKGRLDGFMLRRTKVEVMPELPPRILTMTELQVTEQQLAAVFAEEETMQNRETYLSPTMEDYAQLGDMARLLRLTGEAKVPAVGTWVEERLETVDKIVVFAYHREVIRRLEERLRRYGVVVYHGGMSDTAKKDAVSDFQSAPVRVFIGQIAAAGTGINGLQDVCSEVVFAELSWVPGVMSQAIDRLHRIGQTASCVNIHILHAPGTLESAVLGVQKGKERVIERLMGCGAGNGWEDGRDPLEGIL